MPKRALEDLATSHRFCGGCASLVNYAETTWFWHGTSGLGNQRVQETIPLPTELPEVATFKPRLQRVPELSYGPVALPLSGSQGQGPVAGVFGDASRTASLRAQGRSWAELADV